MMCSHEEKSPSWCPSESLQRCITEGFQSSNRAEEKKKNKILIFSALLRWICCLFFPHYVVFSPLPSLPVASSSTDGTARNYGILVNKAECQ